MRLRSLAVALSCLVPACAAPAYESAVAPAGDFEGASARAREEGKLLLVDFTSRDRRWYGPKEKAPWRDEAVREWIAEHAIAVRIDEGNDPELANRFGIESPPMLVLLRDGAELDRHTDFDDAAGFLEWAEGVLRGRTPRQRHDEELREVARDRHGTGLWRYAQNLLRERNFDAATDAFVMAWDKMREDQQSAEYVLGVLASQMRDLADDHPAARTAFERLLTETELRCFASDPPRSWDFMPWIRLCEAFGKEQRVLSWFEQTRDEDGQLYGSLFAAAANNEQLKVRMLMLEFLIDQRRFDDAAQLYEDPARWASYVSFLMRLGRAVFSGVALTADESSFMRDYPQTITDARLREVARIHAVTLAGGRLEQADQVAHLLLDDDDDGLGRIALVEASLQLKTPPPIEASVWLDEARALGADVDEVRERLVKVTGRQPRQVPAGG